MTYAQTGLQWVPTSPHIPTADVAMYYVATGILGELGVLSEGVGYTLPFRLVGAPWINAARLAAAMNAEHLPGLQFRPVSYRPFYGRDTQKELNGVQLYITNPRTARLIDIQFRMMEMIHAQYPDSDLFGSNKSRIAMFDRVVGDSRIREAFAKRYAFDDIRAMLDDDVAEFKQKVSRYYLYH